MDKDHVEVAARGELAPAVAAHGHQSESVQVPVGGVVQESRQPAVGGLGQGVAEVVTVQVGSFQKLLAQGAERHGWTVPPASAYPSKRRPGVTLQVAGDDGSTVRAGPEEP